MIESNVSIEAEKSRITFEAIEKPLPIVELMPCFIGVEEALNKYLH